MIARALPLALLAGLCVVLLYCCRRHVPAPARPLASKPVAFHGRVLDRDSLLPIAAVHARRLDGKVEVESDSSGVFSFPMDGSSFGACTYSADGSSVSCTEDDPETTRFVLSGNGICPMLVTVLRYRQWEQTSTLLCWRSASVRGIWLDASGAPVASRELILEPANALPMASEEQFAPMRVTTDARGAFRFDAVPSQIECILKPAADHDRFVEFDAPALRLSPGEARDLVVHSTPECAVSGTAFDALGRPTAGAGVVLEKDDCRLHTQTASDGSFAFDRVGAGTYVLKAIYPEQYRGVQECCSTSMTLAGTDAKKHVDLHMHPFDAITGRVLDAHHRPVADAEVWFEPETMPYAGRVDAGRSGEFVLSGLIPGECRIIASGHDRGPHSPVQVVKTGTHDVVMLLEPTGRVAGRIVRGEAGPATAVTIEVARVPPRPVGGGLNPGGSLLAVELPPGRDDFEIDSVPCGTWDVTAKVEDKHVSETRRLEVSADAATPCPDLHLKPGADLWLVAAARTGALDVDVTGEDGVLVHTELTEETIQAVRVPAGKLRVIPRRNGSDLPEIRVDLAPESQAVVGVGLVH